MLRVASLVVLIFTSFFHAVTCSLTDDEEPLPYDVALNITGGKSQLDQEIRKVRAYASTLNNDTPNYADFLSEGGLHGFVLRLRFDDNTTWAEKIAQNLSWQNNDMRDAIRSLKLLERYCPHVPVPRVHGELGSLANRYLIYFLTDWIDGMTLDDDPEYRRSLLNETENGIPLVSYTLPDGLVPQLAEFMYNVTTCPIPEDERASMSCYEG